MTFGKQFRKGIARVIPLMGLALGLSIPALADSTAVLTISGSIGSSTVNGVKVGGGNYSLTALSTAGAALSVVNGDGAMGVSLWSLLGGSSSGASDVVTSTPAGYNGKNAILRSYILATSVTGAQAIISLGEIDPFFGGTGSVPDFISFSAADGKPQLIFPATGASGRNVMDLASLQVLAAPALVSGAGGPSSSFVLSGPSAQAGIYTLSTLQSIPAITETVSGDTYTGVSLWNLLGANTNISISYVLASGTDGYEVLYSLAELNPAYGAPQDLVPYADNQGQFPANGFARLIIPGDNHQGRWVSNLNGLEVVTLSPEPVMTIPIFASLRCYVFSPDDGVQSLLRNRFSGDTLRSRLHGHLARPGAPARL